MIKNKLIFLLSLLWAAEVLAAPHDYVKYFEIDLDAKLPPLEELQQKYVQPDKDYDRRYDYGWNIGEIFDEVFRLTITTVGNSEKRVPIENEKAMVSLLTSIPKEMLEYIGPYLHTIPGMSEKILNMPGIKETKNKFPSRIAPQLAGIEDLEFLSPYLYFVLMPEVWPQKMEMVEIPKFYPTHPKLEHNPKFYDALKRLVPPEDYLPDAEKSSKITSSDFRTINPTKNSLLTSADVMAFANTLDEIDAFGKKDNNMLNLYNIGQLLDMYERDQGKGLMINEIKDMVNPCQRLVQKIRIAGKLKESEFTQIVGKQGFTLNEWAYTCDKSIKAYRLSSVSLSTLNSINAYKNGVYNQDVLNFNKQISGSQFSVMQGIVEMYKAPMSDVLEAKKNRDVLKNKFLKMNKILVASPIETLD